MIQYDQKIRFSISAVPTNVKNLEDTKMTPKNEEDIVSIAM